MPADPDDLARERRPPANREDRADLPSTAERFLPQVGGQRRRSPAGDWSELAEDWPRVRSAGDGGGTAPPAGRSEGATPAVTGPVAAPGADGVSTPPRVAGGSASDRSAVPSAGAKAGPTLGPGGPGPQESAEGASGPELARAVLDAALARRRAAAANPSRRRGAGESTGKRPRGYSGPGPDPRDPQLFGDMLQRLMKARGWERPRAEATVFGAWEKVVGPDIAKHSRPVKLDAGVLTVEAESTAWATQLRLLTARLLRSIAAEVGHNVVTRLNIHGPAAPSWNRGPRRVQGRGPRDTYG